MPKDPNEGVVGFSHVKDGRGVMYLFNCTFDTAQAKVRLDEQAGFRPSDKTAPAYLVYPMKANLGRPGLSYGEELQVPIAGKDCVVIEVGLEAPKDPVSYDRYEAAVASIRPVLRYLVDVACEGCVGAVKQGPVRIEVGKSAGDRRLASQMVETLGAATGRRVDINEWLNTPAGDAQCRLIVGTHDGLRDHKDLGGRFREALYSRYIHWGGQLISGPLMAELEGDGPRTFCLIAPRPEQLARLAINLVSTVVADTRETAAGSADAAMDSCSLAVSASAGQTMLRFQPLMRIVGAITGPGDLSLVRYEIRAEKDGEEKLLWRRGYPPFYSRAGTEAGGRIGSFPSRTSPGSR